MVARGLRGLARLPLALLRRARQAQQRKVSPQAGFALLVVMTTVAVLAAVVGELGYNARVEMEAAANARDALRAEYLARSGVSLARLLIKVQDKVVDPMNKQFKSDFQIVDFAPFLLGAFGGGDEERKGMADLLGFDAGKLANMGLGKGGSFDVVLSTEDGKINLNCGAGFPSQVQLQGQQQGAQASSGSSTPPPPPRPGSMSSQLLLYNLLTATLFPIRYNRLFESANPDGQFYTRDDLARAIIDWGDIDEQRFDPLAAASGGSSGNEDYKYDTLRDPYRARNNYYDTAEEVNLVRGVSDDIWGSFGQMFTVYGGCQVNIRAIATDNWPITAALVRASAANPQDPVLTDDVIVSALSQRLSAVLALPGLVRDLGAVATFFKNSGVPPPPDGLNISQDAIAGLIGGSNLPAINIDGGKLAALARMNVPREIYRIESTGSVKRAGDKKIQVRIRAIFDTRKINSNTTSADINDRVGAWQYWRLE